MIEVERLNGKKYWINPHMIETMEEMPDLTLTMLSGKKIIVKNTSEEVIDRIIQYRNRIGSFTMRGSGNGHTDRGSQVGGIEMTQFDNSEEI